MKRQRYFGEDRESNQQDPRDRQRKVRRIAEYLAGLPDDEIDQIAHGLQDRVNCNELSPFTRAAVNAIEAAADEFIGRDPFFDSMDWKALRYRALIRAGGRCSCCGSDRFSGAILQADHIKPRSKFPDLALDPDNIQVLCKDCNEGKSNRDQTDWRKGPLKR